MSNVAIQKTEIEERFQIKPNKKFNVIGHKSITLLENTAVSTSYQKHIHKTGGGNTINFSVKIGENTFMDTGVILQMTIPMTLTPTAPFTNVPTAANYITEAGGLKDICLRQHGLINALDTITLSLNGDVVTNVSQVHKLMSSISQYYDAESMSKFMPQSQPDRFTSLAHYNAANWDVIGSLNENSERVEIPNNVLSDENIFTGGFSNNYNTRKPYFKFVDGSVNHLDVDITLWSFIPLSVFTLPNAGSLYGINDMVMDFTLRSNFVKHLFSCKEGFWDEIELSSANNRAAQHTTSLMLKYYQPPDYIREAIIDKATGTVKPFRLNYSNIMHTADVITPQAVPARAVGQEIETGQISLGSIPRYVYLRVKNVDANRLKPFNSADFSGRITRVEATIGSSLTSVNDTVRIFNLAKANGLSKDYESAMFTNGYTLRLNFSDDLSIGSNLIGSNVQNTVNFKVTFDSLANSVTTYELQTMFSFASQIVYDGNRHFKTTKSLVLATTNFDISNQIATLYKDYTQDLMIIGGSWLSDLWGNVKKVGKNALKYAINNPDKIFGAVSKLMGGSNINNIVGGAGVTANHNIIGGNSSTMILGAGATRNNIFK